MNVLCFITCCGSFKQRFQIGERWQDNRFRWISIIDCRTEIGNDWLMLCQMCWKKRQKSSCGSLWQTNIDMRSSHWPDIQDHTLLLIIFHGHTSAISVMAIRSAREVILTLNTISFSYFFIVFSSSSTDGRLSDFPLFPNINFNAFLASTIHCVHDHVRL